MYRGLGLQSTNLGRHNLAHSTVVISKGSFVWLHVQFLTRRIFLVGVAEFNVSLESSNVTSPFFLNSWKILIFLVKP